MCVQCIHNIFSTLKENQCKTVKRSRDIVGTSEISNSTRAYQNRGGGGLSNKGRYRCAGHQGLGF